MTNSSCPEPCRLLVTCEHARNRVPAAWRPFFAGSEAILSTHRAYDPGALAMARALAATFGADLLSASVSRLLVDSNRSETNPRVFSSFTRKLDREGRERLLARYYRPHLREVTDNVAAAVSRNLVLVHIGVHTFTPELRGRVRRADVGLLYDPAREKEKTLCGLWQKELRQREPDLLIRRNYPYLGRTDGLPTMLRRQFPASVYLGIELEVNQRLFAGKKGVALGKKIASSLHAALLIFCRALKVERAGPRHL
ncbi:MAG TPA: N-formylglutamate amidohydrolase [Desulfobacteraceae bacterium]|nr:N-formylglutamate amidohydrolase [Desulfobacteraceae bacterium]